MCAFKTRIQLKEIEYKSNIILDIPTRRKSTYLMLERAVMFQKIFEWLKEKDNRFITYLEDDSNDVNESGYEWTQMPSKKLGTPNKND